MPAPPHRHKLSVVSEYDISTKLQATGKLNPVVSLWKQCKLPMSLLQRRTTKLLDFGPTALSLEAATLGRLARPRFMANLGHDRPSKKFLAQLLQAALPVLVLASKLSAYHHDSRGHMLHAHGRVCSVNPLASWAGGMEGLYATVALELLERLTRQGGIVLVR